MEYLLTIFLVLLDGTVYEKQVPVASIEECQDRAHAAMRDARLVLKELGKRPEEFVHVRDAFLWCTKKGLTDEDQS